MRDKLEKIVEAYAELEQKLADPAVVSDPKEYARVAKEHSNQADLVAHANKYITALDDIEAAKELLIQKKKRCCRKTLLLTRKCSHSLKMRLRSC